MRTTRNQATTRIQAGFSLSELVISLATATILLGLATPSFSDFMNKRKVAGAADQIASFFESTKMIAVKRNEFTTITFKKAENGPAWCIGAVIGNATECDCWAEDPVCLIDGSPMVLSDESFAEFEDIETSFADGMLTFDPIRGILTDPTDLVAMDIAHAVEDYQVTVQVNATGGVTRCTPSDKRLVGYKTCI